MTRIALSGRPSCSATMRRMWCGIWVELRSVSLALPVAGIASAARGSIAPPIKRLLKSSILTMCAADANAPRTAFSSPRAQRHCGTGVDDSGEGVELHLHQLGGVEGERVAVRDHSADRLADMTHR